MKKKILATVIAGIFLFSMALPVSAAEFLSHSNEEIVIQTIPEGFVTNAKRFSDKVSEMFPSANVSSMTVVIDDSDESYNINASFTADDKPEVYKNNGMEQRYVPCPGNGSQGNTYVTGTTSIHVYAYGESKCSLFGQRGAGCIYCGDYYDIGSLYLINRHPLGSGDCPN